MTVRLEGNASISILEDECVFPVSARVSSVAVQVNDNLFWVYFNREQHKTEGKNNVYIVIRLHSDVEVISMDMNKDMLDIVDIFGW